MGLKSVFENFSLTNFSLLILDSHIALLLVGLLKIMRKKKLTQSVQLPKELELLKQLIGEWTVGIALKTSEEKIVSGCGEMSAVEIADLGVNSEINTHIEGYDDFYENGTRPLIVIIGRSKAGLAAVPSPAGAAGRSLA